MRILPRILLATIITLASAFTIHAQSSWRSTLEKELPLLGHRNWIVIADSAYPLQTSAGIETVETGDEQIAVVSAVLEALGKTTHVRPIIYTDSELPLVSEGDAKGIAAYRADLAKALASREVQSIPHEDIIAKLDAAGKTFHVLILKTKLTIPYTSVFLQLDCGYWSAEAEARLRSAMKAAH